MRLIVSGSRTITDAARFAKRIAKTGCAQMNMPTRPRLCSLVAACVLLAPAIRAQGAHVLPFEMESTGDAINAEGSWAQVGDTTGFNRVTALNHAVITCHRDFMVCFESVANLSTEADLIIRPGLLLATQFRYDVERWTEKDIVAVGHTIATDGLLRVDLVGRGVEREVRETNARGATGASIGYVERWVLE